MNLIDLSALSPDDSYRALGLAGEQLLHQPLELVVWRNRQYQGHFQTIWGARPPYVTAHVDCYLVYLKKRQAGSPDFLVSGS